MSACAPRLGPGTPRRAVLVGAGLAGAIAAGAAAIAPVLALGLALVAAVVALLVPLPLDRLGRAAIVAAAVAGLAGPNLAPPGAGWLFGFRVVIVAVGLGALAYLLLGRSLRVPAGTGWAACVIGLWIFWSALSVGWADDPVAALRWTAFLTMMGLLALGIVLACTERRWTRILLVALAATFAVAVTIAAAEILTGLHLPSSRPERDQTRIFGATSLFGNQSNFGTYLTLTLPYFAALPLVVRDVRLRALGVAGTAATLLALLYTGSKANLLAAGLVAIALLIALGADPRTRGRLALAAAIAGCAALVVIPAIQGSGVVRLPEQAVTKFDFGLLAAQVEAGTGSGGVRASLAGQGIDLFRDSGGLGVGAGNAEPEIAARDPLIRVTNLHNWWLEVLVNGGVVGLALYLTLYLGLLRGTIRGFRTARTPLVRYLSLAGVGALIGYVVGSLGPSTAIHFAPMWIMFGLALVAIGLARREAAP